MNTYTQLALTVLQALLPVFLPALTAWVIFQANKVLTRYHLDWAQKQLDEVLTDAIAWAESQVEHIKLSTSATPQLTEADMRLNAAVVYAQKELARRQVKFMPKGTEAESTEHLRNMLQSRVMQFQGTFKV